MTDWTPDPVLGPGYSTRTLPLGAGADGVLEAVLVRHDAAAARHRRALLHVHGFNDYFFHAHLAEAMADRGWATYGIDLRRCGRARRPGQLRHYVADLADYDTELDAAVAVLRDDEGHRVVAVEAHSTGGLVAPLWLDRHRGRARVDALVLNSPWFDLAGSWQVRVAAVAATETLGRVRPLTPLPASADQGYADSLHVGRRGEWDFDLDLKPPLIPVLAGWLLAVRRGQSRLHRGLGVDVPTLVLRSARSIEPDGTWRDDYRGADVVLDVRHMSRFAGCVSPRVTVEVVEDGIHDLWLSAPDVRAVAIDTLADWLERTTPAG